MAEENVEIVRRYSEGTPNETVPLEGVLEWMTEFWESDGDYYPVRKFPEARPCHGREEIAQFYTEYRATWALEGELYHCFWLRHGRFIRVEDHLTAKGALHALGLSGETLEAAGLDT